MRLLTEYLSTKVKASNIVASDDTIKQIMIDEINRLGFTANFNHIDVSQCTTLKYLFDTFGKQEHENLYKKFNGDISEWNTSNVTNMNCVFRGCAEFNCDLSKWDVSNVTDMDHIFCDCLEFNQPLNGWKVDKVINMGGVFCGAIKFNQPLNKWNTSSADNMNYMFDDAHKFNQDISMWNVNNVTTKVSIFKNCPIKEEFKPKFN